MTQRLTDDQLARIRQRAEDTTFISAHTKGDPWKGYEVRNDNNEITIAETSTLSDAQFISNARQDIPLLLAEIDRLRKALTYINECASEFYTEEDEEGVLSIPEDLEHHDNMQEIFVVSHEAVNNE